MVCVLSSSNQCQTADITEKRLTKRRHMLKNCSLFGVTFTSFSSSVSDWTVVSCFPARSVPDKSFVYWGHFLRGFELFCCFNVTSLRVWMSNNMVSRDPLLGSLTMLLVEAHRFHTSPCERQSIVCVMRQVTELWERLEGPCEQKYDFLRFRLTALFLWDRSANSVHRDILSPPLTLLENFRMQQQQRLHALPSGRLFHPLEHSSECCTAVCD